MALHRLELPQLSSERLLLRRPTHADAHAISALADDWEVARWMSRIPFPYTRRDALFFIEEVVPNEAAWVIVDRIGAVVIGVIGLTPHEAPGKVELGYWLGQPHWRQGFASEAAGMVLGYAFDVVGLTQIISGCFVGNVRSAHVLQKLGFSEVGESTRWCMAQAKELPHVDMVLTRETWAVSAGST